jgi:hypothetical protein
MAELSERFVPREGMQFNGIDQGSVNVEDRGFGHLMLLFSYPQAVR